MRLAAVALFVLSVAGSAPAAELGIEIVAHRGASHDAPENTVAAIKLAWAQKADASEFDVYMTQDRKLVVIHDRDTRRTAGEPNRVVAESTLEQLRTLDVGRWKGEPFVGERIPTLEEMLATAPAGKRVFIELKCGVDALPELDRVLKVSNLKPQQTVIISSNPEVVGAVKKLSRPNPVFWIVSLQSKSDAAKTPSQVIEQAKKLQVDGLLVPGADTLDVGTTGKVKEAGLKLYASTINDVAIARRLIRTGVDGMTTDRPGWLRSELTR